MLVPVIAFAVSASTRAGTSTVADTSGELGSHSSSRTARRYRSVASSVIVDPSISIRTPVNTGIVSSLPAAVTTCATASEKTVLRTVPLDSGCAGSSGKSSTGSVCRVNRDPPQTS